MTSLLSGRPLVHGVPQCLERLVQSPRTVNDSHRCRTIRAFGSFFTQCGHATRILLPVEHSFQSFHGDNSVKAMPLVRGQVAA